MKRAWIGTALLAASWLLGLSYYHQANWWAWLAAVAVGAVLLGGVAERRPGRLVALVSAGLLIPAIVLAPWPWRAGMLLAAVGLVLCALPIERRWPGRVGSAALAAGVVLLAQSLTMAAYESFTARSPDLPDSLAHLLGRLGGLAGIEAAVNGRDLVLFSMRRLHALGATWALLVDPVTLCFLVGGVVLIALRRWGTASPGRRGAWQIGGYACRLAACVVLWLPMRAVILMAVYMHRALRTAYEQPLDLMSQFWSPWVHLALLAGPVLLAWRFVRPGERPDDSPSAGAGAARPKWQPAAAAGVALAAAAVLTAAVVWEPVGTRKGGRVLVDEYRSQMPWPRKSFDTTRTDKPFDTEWYGHASGYNYACLYDYCSRFYTMTRQTKPIGEDALRDCDVLVLKVPSGGYSKTEIASIRRFVERGGGLLLLGEHTSVYGSGVYLNQVAEQFGFRFRYDCAFGIDSVFVQRFAPPPAPHPILQHMPPLDFATSCTIDPAGSDGRAVIQATGLKNLSANYHAPNYYPQAKDQPEMRYGPFVQLWATRHGAGRVVAFTDSTIFSNFAFFEPGKSELMLGMLEWLNHRSEALDPRLLLVLVGVCLLAGAAALGRPWETCWPLLLAAGALGWAAVVVAVPAAGRAAMPPPKALSPMTTIALDRTVSEARLPRNGFIAGKDDEFGLFERSILRLGYFTRRASGADATKADVVVVLHPGGGDQPTLVRFRRRLIEYVSAGGKLLVLDSPANARSTANSLLHPFGLKVTPVAHLEGTLSGTGDLPAVGVPSACEVTGGEPLARLGGRTVAAVARKGAGSVWVIGFASRFTDAKMGVTGDIVPGAELRKVFDFEFALLRRIAGRAPAATSPAASRPAAGGG